MSLEGQAGVGLAHAGAVIDDLHQCAAGIAYDDAYLRRACVNGILVSSLTTEAGRCMTSPAAIWLATESGRSLIMSLIRAD